MRTLVVCALALACSPAKADEAAVVERLVSFARSGCDFLHAHTFDPPAPVWPPRKVAAQFGRVVRRVPVGATHDYVLAVPAFPRWTIAYSDRIVTFTIPSAMRIPMSRFIKLLGVPHPPDTDAARIADGSAETTTSDTEWEFPLSPDRRTCRLRADTDGARGPLGDQRVLTFSFHD